MNQFGEWLEGGADPVALFLALLLKGCMYYVFSNDGCVSIRSGDVVHVCVNHRG